MLEHTEIEGYYYCDFTYLIIKNTIDKWYFINVSPYIIVEL